jgi:hypothetical protein
MRLNLLLAANVETLIGVAFVVISLISGLLNYISSKAKPNPPNRGAGNRPAKPRSERIQSEIEQFMREQVRRQDGQEAAQRPAEARQQPARPVPQPRKPQERKPQQRPPARRAPEPATQRRPMNESSQRSPASRPGEEISHRKSVGSENLGQSLREHVKATMVERVQSGAEAHLGHQVSAEVTRHLGVFSGGPPSGPSTEPLTPGQSIAFELRSREGLRRALVAQMILERPRSLRRERSADGG